MTMPGKHVFRTIVVLAATVAMSGCITARMEDERQGLTSIGEGESVVIMAKSYHLGNETEQDYISCVEDAMQRGDGKLHIMPHKQFIDALFPWFEPRTAPAETKGLAKLMARPGVAKKLAETGVRYIVWLDGDTERVDQGGSLSCAAGPGGGGCFGFAWWQNDADYKASVWDLQGQESVGSVSADVSGTSYLPALVIPIPLIARTQTAACKGLATQLQAFLISDETV